MNFYLIGTNKLLTNKKTIRYKYGSHYKKYLLVGIISWAKHSRTIILLLKPTFSLVDISRLQVVRFKCSLIIPLTYLLFYAGFDRKTLKQLPLWY